MADDSYFNISDLKLSIKSLYIISDALKYDIIWTENSDVIDCFISEILKYESSVIQSLAEKQYFFIPIIHCIWKVVSDFSIEYYEKKVYARGC